jgi:cellulose synthase/poly-beta-1,6-N-acetylglucosamine synthase-like glycosyltransferase
VKPSSFDVVIPAFNAQETLKACLMSVRNQTVLPNHVMVVDDCSSDRTLQIARRYADQIIHNNNRIGKAASVNKALDVLPLASFVLVLDADTVLEPSFLEEIKRSDCDFGAGHTIFTHKNRFSFHLSNSLNSSFSESYSQKQLSCGNCMFFRLDLLKKERFNEKTLCEDDEIYVRLKRKGFNYCFVGAALSYTYAATSHKQWLRQNLRYRRGLIINKYTRHSYLLHVVQSFFHGKYLVELCRTVLKALIATQMFEFMRLTDLLVNLKVFVEVGLGGRTRFAPNKDW